VFGRDRNIKYMHLAADAAARAEMLISAENEQRRLARALTAMSRAEALRFTGVTAAPDSARFTLSRGEVELHAQAPSRYSARSTRAATGRSICRRDRRITGLRDAGRGLLYVKYNHCADGAPSFAAMVQDIFAVADAQTVQRVVVDLRNNPAATARWCSR
jgi:hypothetical protein